VRADGLGRTRTGIRRRLLQQLITAWLSLSLAMANAVLPFSFCAAASAPDWISMAARSAWFRRRRDHQRGDAAIVLGIDVGAMVDQGLGRLVGVAGNRQHQRRIAAADPLVDVETRLHQRHRGHVPCCTGRRWLARSDHSDSSPSYPPCSPPGSFYQVAVIHPGAAVITGVQPVAVRSVDMALCANRYLTMFSEVLRIALSSGV